MKLAEILDKKRKLGLRLVLSHQHPDQFEDRRIYGSVDGGTQLKAAFYMADSDQRERIAGKFYGGKLSVRDVAYNLSDQKKQVAVIKDGKAAPQLVTIEDVPDADVGDAELERYIRWLYKRPWYKSPDEVEEEIKSRFKDVRPNPAGTNTEGPQHRAAPYRTPAGPPPVSGRVPKRPAKSVLARYEKPPKTGDGGPIKI
jgi:hypothetical protein